MRDFLDLMDFDKILSPPYHSVVQILESQPEVLLLTGRDLIRRNVENEVHRLQFNNNIIDSATDEIWNSRLTTSQRNSFKRLANDINIIRNADTINRMSQISTPQITNSTFEDNIFNGTNFYEDESLQTSILPNGYFCSTIFP